VARTRYRRPRRTWPQRLLLGVNALLVLACLGAAAALTEVRTTLQSVPVVDVGASLGEPAKVTEPRNFLIIGTDSAARLDRSDPVTKGRTMSGQRLADVIMILRVDPRDGSARLLSIPRDSRVALAPDGRYDRINAAIAGANGPRNLVQTIKRNFGISVDNYVEVDFAAFRDLVEVLNGVPVHFAVPVRDRNTGLAVEEAGCIELDPRQALAYARSRHFEFYDRGRWRTDGTGDLGRITRQQDFIKRALRRASDIGIRNPSTAVGLVDAAASAVVLDDTLSAGTILDLLTQFRTFNPDALLTEQVPTSSGARGGVAYQDVEWDAARPLLEPFWGIDPAQGVQPGDVIVDVRAGNAETGAGTLAVERLDAAGFDAELLASRSSTATTTITYGPEGREAARQLARHLQVVPRAVLDDEIVGPRVVLTVGRDFEGVRDQPLADAELPADYLPAPTTTTTEAPPGPTSPAEDSTTTTVIVDGAPPDAPPPGVVPTDPERAAACR
jgi:LCP family protein required for cell wall assembly